MVIFHSYVSLPEGIYNTSPVSTPGLYARARKTSGNTRVLLLGRADLGVRGGANQ